MDFLAVIVAAGSGQRAGPGAAKQWRPLRGRPVARWSLEALLAAGARRVVVVIATGDETVATQAFAGLRNWRLAEGGATRDRSVAAGLEALGAAPDDVVLIHDAARPLVQARHIEALVEGLDGADGALPALAVADTLKRATPGAAASEPQVTATVDRAGLWRAQTP